MELKFLGRGSAFNTALGNTSAWFIENKELFLIDCGSTVFSKLQKLNLLDNIKQINVFITHNHTDHIGSLGTLIEYAYFVKKVKVNIIVEERLKNIEFLKKILEYSGVTRDMYNLVFTKYINGKYKTFNQIDFIETVHVKNLDSYSLSFSTDSGIVYYSGDNCSTNYLEYLITSNKLIDKIYIETTINDLPSNVHLNINQLIALIPPCLKDKVFCMHLESEECIRRVLEEGFHVVGVEKSFAKKLKM